MRVGANAVLILSLLAAGCGAPDSAPNTDGTWVGTITTEGNVTTVVNESGSVWGGMARLEEDLSIGVESGPTPYLFGEVHHLAMDSHRIYVVDSQVSAVRVYDLEGAHLMDVGREGQGPGEFENPDFVGVDAEGRILVQDGAEVEVYAPDGEYLDTFQAEYPYSRGPQAPKISMDATGTVYVPRVAARDEDERWKVEIEVVAFSDEGRGETRLVPQLGYEEPRVIVVMRNERFTSLSAITPWFVPRFVWTTGPSGAIVVGRADRYEIEIHHTDGSVMRISKYWDPAPIPEDERDWYLRLLRATVPRASELRGYDLDAGLPAHRPAFSQLYGDAEGRTWVLRQVGSEHQEPCNETAERASEFWDSPCWRDIYELDAFGDDGRFLGTVQVLERVSFIDPEGARPAMHGDALLTAVEDEAGTIMVKRYRLVLPGEEQ